MPAPPVAGAAAGDALIELLGLNKLPRWNLPGDADAVGLVAGLAAASVFAFLRVRFAFGDAAGDSAVAGEAAVSAGQAVASALLCWRCFFAGEGDSAGNSAGATNWACTTQVLARPITEASAKNLIVITSSVRRLMRIGNEDCSTARIHSCDAAPTPTSFGEIVSDYFPDSFHAAQWCFYCAPHSNHK